MGLFRRRRTLNEELREQAELEAPEATAQPPQGPLYPQPAYLPVGGVNREAAAALTGGYGPQSKAWASVEAPEIEGGEVEFVALPDGSLVVDAEVGDASLDPLARAIEAQLPPPYHAKGVREGKSVWSVWANPTRVEELRADGDELELTVFEGELKLTVDGKPSEASVPELERIGEERGDGYVVRATRLDGDLWEVQTEAL